MRRGPLLRGLLAAGMLLTLALPYSAPFACAQAGSTVATTHDHGVPASHGAPLPGTDAITNGAGELVCHDVGACTASLGALGLQADPGVLVPEPSPAAQWFGIAGLRDTPTIPGTPPPRV